MGRIGEVEKEIEVVPAQEPALPDLPAEEPEKVPVEAPPEKVPV